MSGGPSPASNPSSSRPRNRNPQEKRLVLLYRSPIRRGSRERGGHRRTQPRLAGQGRRRKTAERTAERSPRGRGMDEPRGLLERALQAVEAGAQAPALGARAAPRPRSGRRRWWRPSGSAEGREGTPPDVPRTYGYRPGLDLALLTGPLGFGVKGTHTSQRGIWPTSGPTSSWSRRRRRATSPSHSTRARVRLARTPARAPVRSPAPASLTGRHDSALVARDGAAGQVAKDQAQEDREMPRSASPYARYL